MPESRVRLFCAALAGLALTASGAIPVRATATAASVEALIQPPAVRVVHGDFDGDARLDRCEIVGPSRIAVQLSTASAPQQLTLSEDARQAIVALASVDIDHDGNLDLVATLSDGGIAIWINGGHGEFARAVPRPTPNHVLSSTRLTLPALVSLAGTTGRAAAVSPATGRLLAARDVRTRHDLPHAFVLSLGIGLPPADRAPPLFTV